MADNFTFKDASGVNRTARAKDNSSIHLPATVISDALGNLIAADDAAAAGPIFPLAGVYQSTIDEIDAGDIGRARISARRVQLVVNNDFTGTRALASGVGSAGDMEVSTTAIGSGYVAPTVDFFDGSDSGFSTASRWIRFPMDGYSEAAILFVNALGVNVTLTLSLWFPGFNARAIYSESALANGTYFLTPRNAGTGGTSGVKEIPAMLCPTQYFVVTVTPASDPSSGSISIYINRK